MGILQKKPIEIFCCYAREDRELLLLCRKHLNVLERRDLITVWSDVDINGGEEWEKEIEKHLNSAHIILLFISSDFMQSDYCYSKEMMRAIERHETGEAIVIPILLRPLLFDGAPFAKLQMLPANAEPVTSRNWHTPDEAFSDVAKGIAKQVNSLLAPPTPLHHPANKQRRIFLIPRRVFLIGAGIAIASSCGVASLFLERQTNVKSGEGKGNTPRPTTVLTPSAITYDSYVSQNGIMFGFDAQHTRTNPYEQSLSRDNISQLQQKWFYQTKSSIDSSAPVVANGVVYVGSWDSMLYALDASTGHPKWNTPARTGGRIYSSPAVVNGIVYVGSDDHLLYAFDASTGHPKWDKPAMTHGPIWSSPVVSRGVIYVGSQDGNLYAFDALTGQLKSGWPAFVGDFIDSSPAVNKGIVYVGSNDGNLYAFDALTGQRKQGWPAHTQDVINSSPAVSEDGVYVGSHDGYLYAFDALTGQQKQGWPVHTGAIHDSSPAVADGIVYIGSFKNQKLYAFDAITGHPKWPAPASTNGPVYSSPTVANGMVYIGSLNTGLYAFDALTGQQLQHVLTTKKIVGSPAVANGMVYVGSSDGFLYAFASP